MSANQLSWMNCADVVGEECVVCSFSLYIFEAALSVKRGHSQSSITDVQESYLPACSFKPKNLFKFLLNRVSSYFQMSENILLDSASPSVLCANR